jgi:hypothetical protein
VGHEKSGAKGRSEVEPARIVRRFDYESRKEKGFSQNQIGKREKD